MKELECLFNRLVLLNIKSKSSNIKNRWDFTTYLKNKISSEEYLDTPFEISWQLTGRCNLNCDYCYAKNIRDRKELSTEECHGIIEDLALSKSYDITLEGGEIFLRKDIYELITHIKKHDLFIDILTNGYLINENTVSKLSQVLNPHVDGIQISLDACDNGDIPVEVEKAIRLLLHNNMNVRVNIVLNKCNTANLTRCASFEFPEFANEKNQHIM